MYHYPNWPYGPIPQSTCPNCGHCPCCGRSNQSLPFTWNSNNAGSFTTDAVDNQRQAERERKVEELRQMLEKSGLVKKSGG